MSLFYLHAFINHVISFLLWHGSALVIFRPDILRRQRQVVHILSEVHISIIIQVTRDNFNIEEIAQ